MSVTSVTKLARDRIHTIHKTQSTMPTQTEVCNSISNPCSHTTLTLHTTPDDPRPDPRVGRDLQPRWGEHSRYSSVGHLRNKPARHVSAAQARWSRRRACDVVERRVLVDLGSKAPGRPPPSKERPVNPKFFRCNSKIHAHYLYPIYPIKPKVRPTSQFVDGGRRHIPSRDAT